MPQPTAERKAQALFLESFYKARADFSTIPAHEIRAAGSNKPTKLNPRGEDEVWWLTEGPKMVQRWMDWRAASGWKIWSTPEGTPAIELELSPVWAGVPIKMFIDRVFVNPDTGVPIVVDLKSGKRTPASDLQLAFYAAGIKSVYGVDVSHGAYWMGRTGELSPVASIRRLSLPLITFWVGQFVKARQGSIFLPQLSELCRACG